MDKKELYLRCREELAIERGFKSWRDFFIKSKESNIRAVVICEFLEQVAYRFAIAMCQEQKIECLKSAKVVFSGSDMYGTIDAEVNKQSVVNAKNVAE